MPTAIGDQFQGEWTLYSCSMLAKSLSNISLLYPETKEGSIVQIDSLISIVLSPEIRWYDTLRWGEDPLENLDGDNSHISYLSHLAWMIGNYKKIGGDDKYNELYHSLCKTMSRRIKASDILNCPTYPGEYIYVPDMLVAIVALSEYSKYYNGKYSTIVNRWIHKAQTEWLDKNTGLLVSCLSELTGIIEDMGVKGAYSALNCYYLVLIDDNFAKSQYELLKKYFIKESPIFGLKEYHNYSPILGFDIDAGPILFGLSPSGTAFAVGSATYFGDSVTRKKILKTAEIAGSTCVWNEDRHYLLANVALVGEAIMLAMRTTVNFSTTVSK
ncbi:hypothetical protein GA398_22790 [Bacteroides xylanisolvens]|uniref:Uncharacterized protein n=2 Tax=Bacteroides xylanisolvens TaxID=371601 RepID=A0A7J5PMU5_9BACE|nr:hypothetical protein GA398_22790 [Bacteroides xylanisolvens]